MSHIDFVADRFPSQQAESMRPSIYLETSIISHLAAQPSRNRRGRERTLFTSRWRRRTRWTTSWWNTTHMANAQFRAKVERACRAAGYEPPVLCTPDELMAGEDHDA
jgi:hypothetical protein